MPLSTRESEASLLKQAKECAIDLDRQRSELERADNFPDSSNTEVSKLRQQLLKYNNDLNQAQERQYQLEYQIEMWVYNMRLFWVLYWDVSVQHEFVLSIRLKCYI